MSDTPKITLNGKEYEIMPMNFATLMKVAPKLKSLAAFAPGQFPGEEEFRDIVLIIQLALKRAAPAITFDEVAEGLDMANIHEIMGSVMRSAGAESAGGAKAGNP